MVKHNDVDLDAVFAALSHAARRETLDMLGRGACSVSDLAAPHAMSLAGFMKHVRALEAAGLIACAKEGRTVTCALAPRPLRRASEWMSSRERLWNARLDALGRHLYQREETSPAPKRRR
jgi:DNA-binding transcriptional ArsR family regulator